MTMPTIASIGTYLLLVTLVIEGAFSFRLMWRKQPFDVGRYTLLFGGLLFLTFLGMAGSMHEGRGTGMMGTIIVLAFLLAFAWPIGIVLCHVSFSTLNEGFERSNRRE
jgi:hypothetical protein